MLMPSLLNQLCRSGAVNNMRIRIGDCGNVGILLVTVILSLRQTIFVETLIQDSQLCAGLVDNKSTQGSQNRISHSGFEEVTDQSEPQILTDRLLPL